MHIDSLDAFLIWLWNNDKDFYFLVYAKREFFLKWFKKAKKEKKSK